MALDDSEKYIVDNQDPFTRCAGGKIFDECPAAEELFEFSQEYIPDRFNTALDETVHFDELAYSALKCATCNATCRALVGMYQRKPTGHVRVVSIPPKVP